MHRWSCRPPAGCGAHERRFRDIRRYPERPIEDTQRLERPVRDIGHVPNGPFAPWMRVERSPRSGQSLPRGPGEAGLPAKRGFVPAAQNKLQRQGSVVAAG
jgi:hypothetical protein